MNEDRPGRSRGRSERSRQRRARREAVSGSGPVPDEQAPGRWPGATGGFALFAEAMVTGLLVTLVALPVITLPLALAVGFRHLRRYLRAEDHGVREVWDDVVHGLLPSLLVGLGLVVVSLVLALDIVLGGAGVLPGGTVVVVVGWAVAAVTAVGLVVAARSWDPATGWRRALRGVPEELAADPVGALYVLAAVVFVGVITWQLAPLLVPGLGMLVFAALAVPERLVARATRPDDD